MTEFDIDANQNANHEDGTYHRELDPSDSHFDTQQSGVIYDEAQQFDIQPSGEPAEGLQEGVTVVSPEAFDAEVAELDDMHELLLGLQASNARLQTPAERKAASTRAQQDAEKLKAKRRAASKRASKSRKKS